MSSTELSVKSVDFPALSPSSRQMKVIAANLAGEKMSEMDLVSVHAPVGGKSVKWEIEADGNSETTDEIVGVLVGVAKRGTLWPFEDPSDARPVVVSHDLQIGYRVGDKLGDVREEDLEKFRVGDRRYDWQALANSQEFGLGSARNGTGKKAKEARILAVLRQGDTWPLLVHVGVGSFKNLLPFLKRLPCFTHEAVIGLRLKIEKSAGGIAFAQVVPRLVGQLTEEQGDVARKVYADPIAAMFAEVPMAFAPKGGEAPF
jgi:hypothetical protein